MTPVTQLNKKTIACSISLLLVCVSLVHASEVNDVIRFDFERGDLQGWVVIEEGFGNLVSDIFNTPYMPR